MSEAHEYAGVQFPGRQEVQTVMAELERQKRDRKDLVVNTKDLELREVDNQLVLQVNGAERHMVPMSRRVWSQVLSQRLGIRMTDRFYKWLMFGTQTPFGREGSKTFTDKAQRKTIEVHRNWDTLQALVNDYFHKEKEGVMVRMLKDQSGHLYCRALLSDRYEVVPNADFFYAIVEALQDAGAQVWHARLSEDKFYGYAVAPHITAEVNTERAFDPGDGWKSRWYGKKNDVMNAAMAFGNSETGDGGIFLANAILRRVCENYCVWHDIVSRTHLGKRHEMDRLLSDETIRERNKLFFMKIKDYVRGTFNVLEFQKLVDSLNGATKDAVEDPEKAAEALQVCYDMSEERKAAIRNLFIKNQDMSRYGLIQAVTEYAHDKKVDPDAGFDLERLAPELLGADMERLYKKAEALKKARAKASEPAVASAAAVGVDIE